MRDKFEAAAAVLPEWGARPWQAYRAAAGPVVPGAQPKICVVLCDDGKYRVPVRQEDTPEYRADMKAHWLGQAIEYVTRKPADEWEARIHKFSHYLHSAAAQMSTEENAQVMTDLIDHLLQRPEVGGGAPAAVMVARLEFVK